jgi:chromate transport protein ChrA
MSINNQEIDDFFSEDLYEKNKSYNDKNNTNTQENKLEKKESNSSRSSLDLEKINYFAVLSDNENLKQNFLNDNLFPIELVRQGYSQSIDSPMSLEDVIKSSLYLGFTNFGVMQVKEKKTFLYFVVQRKLMDEYTFIKLFSLCELIPGATLIQILLCVYYIKTKSFWIALLGIGMFLLPGIFCLTATYLVIYKSINKFYESKFFLILETGVAQSGLALLLNFLTFQFIKLLNSNFQSGIVIITVVTLLIKDNLVIMLSLFCIMGYLSMKKSEHQTIKNYLDDTIIEAQRYSSSNYAYIAILIYLICFIFICFFTYVLRLDKEVLILKFYTVGSLIFMDYSTINFLDSYIHFGLDKIIISFGFICLFQGHVFNLLIVLMMESGLLKMLGYLMVLYFPSIIFGYLGLKTANKIDNNQELQLFLIGIRTTSLDFIFSIVPNLWKSTCLDNKYYHWTFGTIIVLNGWYWFYKRKFLLGNIVTIACSVLIAILTDSFSSNK